MANLVVTPQKTSFDMYFANLQYPDSAYSQFAYEVGGNIINATINGINWPGLTGFPPLTCGTTYLVRGAVLYNGTWYTIESGAYYSTLSCRPSNWSWPFSVASGQPCSIPASEWIAFQNRINEFRVYKGLSNYGFTTSTYVVTGQPFMAFLANQAVNAIDDMNPPTTQPATVSTGDSFTAAWLNQLTNSLNSIL